MNQDLHEWCGAYVVDALEPDERAEFEQHLEACATCRATVVELSVLPGMVRRAVSLLPHLPAEPPPVVMPVTAARSRRAVWAAAGLGLVAAAAAFAVGVVVGRPPGGEAVAMVLTGSSSGDVAELRPRPWGSEVTLELEGLPSDVTLVALAVASDGSEEQVATWSATASGRVLVVGASSLPTGQIAEVRIATASGTEVRSLDRSDQSA